METGGRMEEGDTRIDCSSWRRRRQHERRREEIQGMLDERTGREREIEKKMVKEEERGNWR